MVQVGIYVIGLRVAFLGRLKKHWAYLFNKRLRPSISGTSK